MNVKCLYFCNNSRLVVKNKQPNLDQCCVFISGRNKSELIFICRPCLYYFQGLFHNELKKMYGRNIFMRKWRDRFCSSIQSIKLLGDKYKQVKGKIVIGHCRGHDYIITFFQFKSFHKNHRRLFPKIIFWRWDKMGCCFSNSRKLTIEIIENIDPSKESLCEKCPNTEHFLVGIFLHSD